MNRPLVQIRLRETFAAKIFIVIILLILVLSSSFTAFFVYNQWQSRSDILVRQGEMLARLLAYTARLGVFAENQDLLKDPVTGVLQNSEVLRVSVFSANGMLLIEKSKPGKGNAKPDQRLSDSRLKEIFNRVGKSGYIEHGTGDSSLIEFWAPVLADMESSGDEALFFSDALLRPRERTIGFVQVVLDKSILNTALQNILLNSSMIALVFLLAAFVIVFFVVKGVAGPLNRLTERVRMMGSGAPLEKVPIETGDEIGKLAGAFNAMTESLKSREEEKSHLENQLRQAHKMEAIGTLAGGVAHDFNNILSTIEGYALLLRESIRRKSQLGNYVDQIVAAAERASDLTKRLLAFSRNQVINPVPVNINQTIRTIKPLLARFVGESIDFSIRTSSEELVVMADEIQIEQTLINLVTNARDAMPQGGTLEISSELVTVAGESEEHPKEVMPGTYAKLTISDTGSGIDPMLADRIFDPFFTTKEVGRGTGLGLSMAYGIVKQHKGYIEVKSEPGRGTVFFIYLPLIDSEVEKKRREASLLPAGNRETILLAEDDRFVRMLTKHILTKYGYNVIEAVDGCDAMEKFREHLETVNLMLLDVIMPKKSGKEVYDEARRIRPAIRCIFMSGHPYDVITEQGLITQELTLISKPLTPGELLLRVREALDDSSGERNPVAAGSRSSASGLS